MQELIDRKPIARPLAPADRPLLGLTILLVEDSRLCSETVRLMCQRSGARLRRADSLLSARRHLATYRPSLVLVDIGLPDGSGLDLVRALASHRPNAPVILVTSGEDAGLCRAGASDAGADGFIEKPVRDIKEFQRIILSFFPGHRAGAAANVVPFYPLGAPNQQMVAEDLQQAQSLLHDAVARDDKALILYGAQFLHSVAEAAGNEKLSDLALRLGKSTRQGRPLAAQAANLQSYLSRQIEDRQKPVQ